jgi:hypothetical protein
MILPHLAPCKATKGIIGACTYTRSQRDTKSRILYRIHGSDKETDEHDDEYELLRILV